MKTIKRWMRQLGFWLINKGTEPTLEVKAPTLPELASTLVKRQDRLFPDHDGEAKRARVLWQLKQTFPNHDGREISRAIEEAL